MMATDMYPLNRECSSIGQEVLFGLVASSSCILSLWSQCRKLVSGRAAPGAELHITDTWATPLFGYIEVDSVDLTSGQAIGDLLNGSALQMELLI